ncbi:crotonase/enoyl-CoA hydratase family protein [Neisseriaceae bacterium TC5R-5]|nr:crotonase/enoyl-CoA hydratase family protein [Neisseriaceae bacterium TC5R-5]
MLDLSTLTVEQDNQVALIHFNRPDKANALSYSMWEELRTAFEWADQEPSVRAVVLAGHGKHFCAGLDLSTMLGLQAGIQDDCEGRKREKLRRLIINLQDCVNSIERCSKPVIAAIQGACLGGGLDVALAADYRFAAADAIFGVRELDISLVADLGSLQRLPRVVGEGMAREMALTARNVSAAEALTIRLVNRVLPDADSTLLMAMESASLIASKSPLAVRGSKEVLNYSRDHSVTEGLNYVATWSAATLISEDLKRSSQAAMRQQEAIFPD